MADGIVRPPHPHQGLAKGGLRLACSAIGQHFEDGEAGLEVLLGGAPRSPR
ncbi:MAG: hypothetical protein U0470_08885 [Anaerolineae bacterium]